MPDNSRVRVDGFGRSVSQKAVHAAKESEKVLTNAVGNPIIEVKPSEVKTTGGIPNSITQTKNSKGGINRNYYDENGVQKKQISNNDHGHKAESHFGKNGEHAHDYYFDENGINQHGKPRELTDEERKENSDIL